MKLKSGDKVKVHYTLKINDGEVVESSFDAMPMEFALGEGKMIEGFEKGIAGMTVGEKKTIQIPSDQAYGTRNESKVFEFPKNRCPEGFTPEVGQMVQMFWPDGKSFMVTVKNLTENGFTMDANHPLAGKDLTFDLELVEIAS